MSTELLLRDIEQQAIFEACQLHSVKRLELFGSRSRQDHSAGSDFDFLVEFTDPLNPGLFERFLGLRAALERVLGGEIDLVEVSSIENPFLLRRIKEDRKLIYAA